MLRGFDAGNRIQEARLIFVILRRCHVHKREGNLWKFLTEEVHCSPEVFLRFQVGADADEDVCYGRLMVTETAAVPGRMNFCSVTSMLSRENSLRRVEAISSVNLSSVFLSSFASIFILVYTLS